jgi:hypothetical protein
MLAVTAVWGLTPDGTAGVAGLAAGPQHRRSPAAPRPAAGLRLVLVSLVVRTAHAGVGERAGSMSTP